MCRIPSGKVMEVGATHITALDEECRPHRGVEGGRCHRRGLCVQTPITKLEDQKILRDTDLFSINFSFVYSLPHLIFLFGRFTKKWSVGDALW